MTYAFQAITDLYANGLGNIISPPLAGALFVFFFLGIVFLRGIPTSAKVVIGLPALFIGFALLASDFVVLLTVGLGVLFMYALWKMFGNK